MAEVSWVGRCGRGAAIALCATMLPMASRAQSPPGGPHRTIEREGSGRSLSPLDNGKPLSRLISSKARRCCVVPRRPDRALLQRDRAVNPPLQLLPCSQVLIIP